MKILFITDTTIRGRSGVGDYTICLCEELRGLGVDCDILGLSTLFSISYNEIFDRVRFYNPTWVSVQFAPNVYSRRGLVTPWSFPWNALRKWPVHFMFHETWIGVHKGAQTRERYIGKFQKLGIKLTLKSVKPRVIHSTNYLSSSILASSGIANKILPLFGAIPVVKSTSDPYIDELLKFSSENVRSDWFVATFFGSLHNSSYLSQAIFRLQTLCLKIRKKLLIVSVGHSHQVNTIFDSLDLTLPIFGKPHFLIKGPMDQSEISRWLGYADCGLSTTPINIIEKSSSAAAFIDHGVPVVVLDQGSDVHGIDTKRVDHGNKFILYTDLSEACFPSFPFKFDALPLRTTVTRKFLNDLSLNRRNK